eukprot:TRINITY_DN4316_c0_g5_i2.p1 TRINITY_DN4316_c0_g5~~TRINITY_DN4316_c0_g5_i2.p1  ORF type:complete len:216 (-),score=76.09 TRINITY_DN4316_c0_g5_i2:443-1090(-)
MKFKFCGDLDAPDWLLRETDVISRMTYVRIKLLAMHIIGTMMGTTEMDYDKVRKLVATASFDTSDTRAVIAALRFVLHSAAKHGVEPATLAAELGQIGLPNEHTLALQRAYAPQRDKLRARLANDTLAALPHVDPRANGVEWRVDYVLASSTVLAVGQPTVQLRLALRGGPVGSSEHACAFEMSADKFRVFHHEMRALLDAMDGVSATQEEVSAN